MIQNYLSNFLRKILSPEEEFKSRKPVLAAYAGSEFGIFLHSLPYLEVPFRVNEVKPHAWIYLIEDLYMEPGRSMRFKCRSNPLRRNLYCFRSKRAFSRSCPAKTGSQIIYEFEVTKSKPMPKA